MRNKWYHFDEKLGTNFKKNPRPAKLTNDKLWWPFRRVITLQYIKRKKFEKELFKVVKMVVWPLLNHRWCLYERCRASLALHRVTVHDVGFWNFGLNFALNAIFGRKVEPKSRHSSLSPRNCGLFCNCVHFTERELAVHDTCPNLRSTLVNPSDHIRCLLRFDSRGLPPRLHQI